MADPQTADQGFLAGLLGKFGADPAAAYGGLLSDPATQRQFALRSLGAAAQAMAQASMPVPYKGGTPWGSFLGSAGGAAATAGDALMHARLEQAQQQQALANVGLSQQQVTLMQAALPGLKSLISTGQAGLGPGGSGTAGTGAGGAALTGPAKIIADSKGTVFDTGDPFLNLVAHHESGFKPNVGWEGMPNSPDYSPNGTDLSGYALDKTGFPDWPGKMGPAGNSTAAGLFQITGENWHKIAPGLIASGAMKPDFSPESQIAVAKVMLNQPGGKDNWLKYNPALATSYARGDVIKVPGSAASPQTAGPPAATQPPAPTPQQTANGPPTGLLTPPADLGPQTASGGAYSVPPPPGPPPKPGEYAIPVRAGNVPPPPAAPAPAGPPMAQPAAPRGLLDTSQGPLGSSAAPPQLATPPEAGAPGPVTGLLRQQPTQQVAATDAPQLSPAAAAVLQGINRQQAGGGLLASGSVAGDNAVPSGEPPAVAQAGPPHTGAAGAAELAGLLAQQPASAAPPTATPYTNAPPANGQGAPAPGPAPTGPPIAPPLNLPPIPSQMPAMPNLPAIQPTPQQQIAQGVAGLMALSGHPAPPWIDDLAKMPAQMAMEQYKAWVGGQANMMTEQYKKQIEVAAAGTISYLQSQGQLPADLTKMTNEQNLKLRNSMAEKGLEQKPDGSWGFMPGYVEQQGQLKKQEQDLQQQREIAVKNAEQTAIAQREQQNRDATLAQLPLQERQKALFTDYADNVQKPAGTADTARRTLAALGNSLSNFQTGATAPQRLEIAKMWSDAVTTLGVTPSPAVRQMIASGETIGKEGNTLGFELAKELGSRESQMVIQAAIASNPGLAMSPQGNAQLIKLLDNGLQRDIAKKSFYDQYFTVNHTYEGADTAFRKVNPVEVTVSSVPGLEYHPKTPQEVASYPSGTRYVRPDVPGQVFTVR